MTTFETISLMIAFGMLVAVLSKKEKQTSLEPLNLKGQVYHQDPVEQAPQWAAFCTMTRLLAAVGSFLFYAFLKEEIRLNKPQKLKDATVPYFNCIPSTILDYGYYNTHVF